ncbi:MAG: hypothetical protein WC346_00115 [Methanogenium sp.]|jgi:hypothetical protein
MKKYLVSLKRVKFELGLLGILMLLCCLTPTKWLEPDQIDAKIAFFTVLFGKLLYINFGILYAHISRKILFPYIDINLLIKGKSKEGEGPVNSGQTVLFMAVWYGIIIWSMARGG